ncbi:MAG TPA: hypothetical protein VKR61_00640 [Bryobacteraceae bacterium]|nr:hypothetical protein [Bryobacteraceae bacterium]
MTFDHVAWNEVEESLWRAGYSRLPAVLTAAECAALIGLYPRRELFRSRMLDGGAGSRGALPAQARQVHGAVPFGGAG